MTNIRVGIEALNFYTGSAVLNVADLAKARRLDNERFGNLMMSEKSMVMPYEDPVSCAINAAKPIVDGLSEAEKNRIEMVVTCTESAIDFGKSISTYVHHYLGLNRNCRLFELKNACYSGTAGLQMAVNFILSQVSPGAKALVVCTDITRMTVVDDSMDTSFAEPSSGAGAVVALVSDYPQVFEVDVGANGYYGYEVMDTCRPTPDQEAGDADLSLLSYLDCCENAYKEYEKRVEGADYQDSFHYLAFHTPFGGMVKGAHRAMMRKFKKAKPTAIEADFETRVMPSLKYCQRVGNIMGATTFLALCSAIDNGNFDQPKRIGVFSYGSGCCSEFYSGIVTSQSQQVQARQQLAQQLDNRYLMTMKQYESLFKHNAKVRFGTRNVKTDTRVLPQVYDVLKSNKRIILKKINNYHREYDWA